MSDHTIDIIDNPDNPHILITIDGQQWRIPLKDKKPWAAHLIKKLANILAKTN